MLNELSHFRIIDIQQTYGYLGRRRAFKKGYMQNKSSFSNEFESDNAA